MKRVLCAVDLSDLSVEPLECAAAIGQWYGGCLAILHVVPTFDAVERHHDEVIEQMRQTAIAAGIPDDRVRYEAESGEPGMTIVARLSRFGRIRSCLAHAPDAASIACSGQ